MIEKHHRLRSHAPRRISSHGVFRAAKPVVALALVTALGVCLPLAYLLIRALDADREELQNLVFQWRNLKLIANTVALAAGVVVCSQLLAFPFALLTTRVRWKLQRVVTVLCVLPLAVPPYVMAYAYRALGGDYGTGYHLTGFALPRVAGFWGSLLTLTLCSFPYLFLNLRAALQRADTSVEEAARMLGCTRRRAFWRAIYPQLRPAAASGRLLIVLHVLADFGVVSLMGYETFSYALFTQYSSAFDHTYAACLALLLLLLTALVVAVELRGLRRLRLETVGASVDRTRRQQRLGRMAVPAYVLIASTTLLAVIIPLATIGFWFVSGWRADADSVWPDVLDALWTSGLASLPAALLTTAIAIPLTFQMVRGRGKLSRAIETGAYLGYAVPPLAFALGLIFFSIRIDGVGRQLGFETPLVYQSWSLLIAAYALRYLVEAVGPLKSGVAKVRPSLEEAARSLGCSPQAVFFRVTLPALLPSILVSLAFVFISVMKELPLTLLLSPVGFETLATGVWHQVEDARFPQAAPYALVLVALSSLFVGLLLCVEKRSAAA